MEVNLPYGVMDAYPGGLQLAVESERISGAPTEQLPLGFLPAHLRLQTVSGTPDPRPTANFTLKSFITTFPPDEVATLRYQEAADRFQSPWVVIIADPRGSIRWTPVIPDKRAVGCFPCERPPQVVGKTEAAGVYEMWAHGRSVDVRPDGVIGGGYAYLGQQRRLEKRVTSVMADTIRVADQVLPSKMPPLFGTQSVNDVLVHSGELVRERVDLAIKGRGLDFVLRRFYSSAVYSFGPLGRNFDSPLFARVRWSPAGGLMFYDGTGRVQHFATDLAPYPGVFLRARNSERGVVIAYPDNTMYHFDLYGRLAKITDPNMTRVDESDGNVMRFLYNAEGRLDTVVDPVGRIIRFEYFAPTAGASGGRYPGLLSTVTDFTGRIVKYRYDQYGRLTTVTGPDPMSPRSAQQVITYTWGPPTSGNFRLDVLRSGQITSEKDGKGRTLYTITYNGDAAWRADSVTTSLGTWNYSYSAGTTTVINPLGRSVKYALDNEGRVTSVMEPDGATTRYAFDGEGRLTAVIRPMGTETPLSDATTYAYASAEYSDKRPMLNVTQISQLPRPGSDEAAAGMVRTTAIMYGERNQPTKIVEPTGTTVIARDVRGNPSSVTDAVGVTTTFEFDPQGRIKKVQNPRAGTTTYAYHTTGYLANETIGAGTIEYTVDARGNVTKVTQPNGAPTTYLVNALDQVEEEKSTTRTAVLNYDAAGSLVSHSVLASTDAGTPIFSATTIESDEAGRVKLRIEDGATTQYDYDAAGNVKTVARSGAAPVTYEYDARDRLVTVTEGTRATQYGYDEDGVQITATNPLGKTWTKILNGFGERTGGVDPLGLANVSTTDAAGRPVDSRVVKKLQSGEQLLLRWSQREYDPLGRVTRDVRKLFTSPLPIPAIGDPSGATDLVMATIYDDATRKTTTVDPRGVATVTERDELGRVARVTDGAGNVIETTYDESGNRVTEKHLDRRPDGTTETFTKRFEYDRENRLIASIDTSDEARSLITSYRYDARGNLAELTDVEGRTRKFEYDLRGNRTKEIDPEEGVTEFAYDDAGNLRTIRDANRNVTTFTTDGYGNVIEEKRADGATWTMTYDESNNQKTLTDPNGTTTTFGYDDANRLTSKTIAKAANVLGPSSVTFTLDDLGRVVGTATSAGVKTTSSFDSFDRELTETQQIGSGAARTIAKAFDASGNLKSLTYPSGMTLTRTIDPLGRIAAVTQIGTTAPIVTYADAGSRLVARTLANGIASVWSYDSHARLSAIKDNVASDVVRDIAYERSQTGIKTAVTRTDLGKQWTYAYNRNASVTNESVRRIDTEANPLLLWTEYLIDPALNYRKIARTVQTTETSTTVTAETAINARNQYTAFAGQSLSYDANGNLTQAAGVALQYDADNRLSKATLANGTVVENQYDANGRKVLERMSMTGHTHTTEFVLAGNEVIEEYGNDALVARYVRGRGIDEIVRAEANGLTLYPLQDELGNVDRLTDAAGNTLERYEYEGYGRFRTFAPGGSERSESAYGWRWLFQGREYTASLGAYDFRSRTLWPLLGRFGQEDMLQHEMPESTNLYQAFKLSYLNLTDPMGRWTVDPMVDKPPLRAAMRLARELYRTYNLESVYKAINPNFNGEFLLDGKSPRLSALIGGGANLQNPVWNSVEINTLLLRTALRHNGAKATLTIGLLHEQAHAEGKLRGRADSERGVYEWHDRYSIPDQIHLGWLTDQVIFDGALFLYHPEKVEYAFMSAKALNKSPAAQIVDIRNGRKRFTRWFGDIPDAIGVVFDHKKRQNILVDPNTGKPLNPVEELLSQQ